MGTNRMQMQDNNSTRMDAVGRMQAQAQERGKKGKRVIIVIVLLLISIAAGALAWLYTCSNVDMPGKPRNLNAELGMLDGKTDAEIQAELNRVVDESMFDISIASTMEFPDGASEGDIRIENVPGNRYLLECQLIETETGAVLYESGILEPNHHISKGKLLKDLEAGVYSALAVFTALDPDTEDEVGKSNVEVTIIVQN